LIQRLREEKLELSLRSVESIGYGRATNGKGEDKRKRAARMRRNFVKREEEKLLYFGSDSVE